MRDAESLELARAGLHEYGKALTPAYEMLRESLNGRLGGLATQEGIAASRENVDLVNQAVNALFPDVSARGGGKLNSFYKVVYTPQGNKKEMAQIDCSDQASARMVQSACIWYMHDYGNRGDGVKEYLKSEPLFIIGKKDLGKKTTVLMLRSANPVQRDPDGNAKIPTTGPFVVTMKRKKAAKLQRQLQEPLRSPFSDEQSKVVYVPKEGCYRIGRYSPGSVRLASRRYQRDDFTHGISDLDLAEFDVWTRIYDLAAKFGKIEQVDQVLKTAQQG